MDSSTFGIERAANYLGCSPWKLRDLAKRGAVPHFRIGNRFMFRRAALDKWMQEMEDASVHQESNSGVVRRLK